MNIRKIGTVLTERKTPVDDNWQGVLSILELEEDIPFEAFDGLEDFSHIMVTFQFHLVEEPGFCGKRHPRGNINWPQVGTFAQRNKNRINRIGICQCKMIKRLRENQIQVEGLDAIHQTPIIDIKPIFKEFSVDKKEIVQPQWVGELMTNYWSA